MEFSKVRLLVLVGIVVVGTAAAACTRTSVETGDTGDTEVPDPPACEPTAWCWGRNNPIGASEGQYVAEAPTDLSDFVAPGDLDGDGLPDLVIGAQGNAEVAEQSGKAYFVTDVADRALGRSLADYPAVRGDAAFSRVGYPMPVGDVDADGLADLAFTMPNTDAAGEYLVHGRAEWWTGSSSLVPIAGAVARDPTVIGSSDIMSAGRIGDVDGDGADDWLIGGRWQEQGHLFSGAHAAGVLAVPSNDDVWLHGGTGWHRYWDPGDIDGDGLVDVLGSDDRDSFVWFGGDAARDVEIDAIPARLAHTWVDVVGDVNGDGRDDLAMTLLNEGGGGIALFFGRDAWSGTLAPGDADVLLAPGAYLSSPTPLGDVNGDGLTDLAIHAQVASGSADSDVWLVFGRSAWPDRIDAEDVDVKLVRGRDGESAFFRSTGPIDVDGDGLNDVLVNVPYLWPNFIEEGGVIFVFRGRSDWPAELSFDAVDVTFSGTSRFAALGSRLAVDDFDGDQRDDLVVVDPNRGKVVVLYGQAIPAP